MFLGGGDFLLIEERLGGLGADGTKRIVLIDVSNFGIHDGLLSVLVDDSPLSEASQGRPEGACILPLTA